MMLPDNGGDDYMKQINRRGFVKAAGALVATPVLGSLPAFAAQAPQAPNTSDLRVDKDIVFGKGGDMDLLLDVYHPPQGVTPKRLGIIHLFGGGFFTGNKNAGYIVNDVRALGKLGYTNISANYRLTNQGLWPAQINDTKAAIRWVRANAAKIGIDADKIAIASVQMAAALFPTNLSAEERTKMMDAASPTKYIGKSFAPTIFIHGTADMTVPLSSSLDFFTKLNAAGVPTSITTIQGAAHAFDNAALDAVEVMAHSIDLFLDRLIVNPKPYPSFGGGGGGRRGGGRGQGPGAGSRGNQD
jgi:acetyl esterase/lipase